MAQKIILEVSRKEYVAPNIYLVTFRVVDPPQLSFKAGQNMMLMIGPGVNRTMSIASPPSLKSELVMVHDVSPMGPGSKWTIGLKPGDRATVVAPTGGVLSLMDTPCRKVMVATGTGVAPFRAEILERIEGKGKHGDLGQRGEQIQLMLYWGLRHEEDRYWTEEFDRLAADHPNFRWYQVLSQPKPQWQGLRGHVTEHVLMKETDLANSEFYLCGNREMVNQMREKLLEKGVPGEQIKSELFY